MILFQFTRPAWGATRVSIMSISAHTVSIHAPRVGRDLSKGKQKENDMFQFTRPAWGATIGYQPVPLDMEFQFTRPAWGATVRWRWLAGWT